MKQTTHPTNCKCEGTGQYIAHDNELRDCEATWRSITPAPDLSISYHVGDILDSNEPVIMHGCNMTGDPMFYAAGMAGAVGKRYPIARGAWVDAVHAGAFNGGDINTVWITSDLAFPGGRCIINAATQVNPGADARASFIELAMLNLSGWCQKVGCIKVAMPRIGCGIGGLGWDTDVLPAISKAHHDVAVIGLSFPHVAIYDLPPKVAVLGGGGNLYAPRRAMTRKGRV